LKKDNIEFIIPAYRIFLDKYKRMNFTRNPDKYIKYSVEDVESMINRFFDTAA
jgi:exocyst complex protein 7